MRTKGRYRIDLSSLSPVEVGKSQTIINKGLFNVLHPPRIITGTSGDYTFNFYIPSAVDISLYNFRYKIDGYDTVVYPLLNINFITQSLDRNGWVWKAEIEVYKDIILTINASPYEIGNRTEVYGMELEIILTNKEV